MVPTLFVTRVSVVWLALQRAHICGMNICNLVGYTRIHFCDTNFDIVVCDATSTLLVTRDMYFDWVHNMYVYVTLVSLMWFATKSHILLL